MFCYCIDPTVGDFVGFCPWFLQDSFAGPLEAWLIYKLLCSALKNWREAKDFHAARYPVIHSITSYEKCLSNYLPKLYKLCKQHSSNWSQKVTEAFYANIYGSVGFVVCLVVCFCLKLHQFRHKVAILFLRLTKQTSNAWLTSFIWRENRRLKWFCTPHWTPYSNTHHADIFICSNRFLINNSTDKYDQWGLISAR